MIKWCQGERVDSLRQLILRLMGLVYSFAFAGWYYQIPELYGEAGLLPVSRVNPYANEQILDMLCISGTVLGLAVFISGNFVKWYVFSLLWGLYLVLFWVGQDFAQFQWDILLVECGFICILFSVSMVVGRELLRWLAFRLYFSSGLLKLLSQCPTWWNLTALHYHFASQCIPHFLSWWAHQLPDEMKKFMVAGNFYTLIVGAVFFYFPWRPVRIFGFLLQLLMQVSIILTGNYNFFNILSIILAMVVLDDGFLRTWFPKRLTKIVNLKEIETDNKKIFNLPAIAICTYATGVIIYNVFYESIMEKRKLPFGVEDLAKFLQEYLPYFLMYVLSFFFYQLTYFNMQKNSESSRGAIRSALTTLLSILVFIGMFSMSNLPFQQGLGFREINSPLIPQEYLYQARSYTNNLRLFNSYGLFMRMTGVGGRPELIFEGSDDLQKWTEYEFYYKPGTLDEISPFIVPHQPRLDWQLWFAAFQEQPRDLYMVHLVYKILNGQATFIKQHKPHKFVRIRKFLYYYTNTTEMVKSGQFWKRTFQSEYLPPTTSEHLRELAQQYNLVREGPKNYRLPFWTLISSVIIYKLFM